MKNLRLIALFLASVFLPLAAYATNWSAIWGSTIAGGVYACSDGTNTGQLDQCALTDNGTTVSSTEPLSVTGLIGSTVGYQVGGVTVIPAISANTGYAVASNGSGNAPTYQNTSALAASFAGYVASNWVPTFNFTTASPISVSGSIYCAPFSIFPPGATISNLGVGVTTLSAGGHIYAAIYNNGSWGRPSTMAAVTSTALSTASVANVSGATSTSIGGGTANVALTPGVYWACVQQDNATSKYVALSANASTSIKQSGSATLGNVLSLSTQLTGVSITGTYGTMGTFNSGTTWSDSSASGSYGPVIAMEIASSP
jgi:hypothetical protein